MLGSSKVMAFVVTAQPDAARSFYETTLGLRLVEGTSYALVFDAHGTTLRVQKVQAVMPAPYTTLGWVVGDIVAAVRELSSRGLPFERFDGLEQDELGIWSSGGGRIAWFRDPDGNRLSVTQS